MEKQNEKGINFSRLTSQRGVSARIAKTLEITPVRVNNWKTRGVPPGYAYRVAEILGCEPWEISDILPPERISPADVQARAARLTPDRQLELSKHLDFLLWQQLQDE